MPEPLLYDYYRSSACYRVRIALNLKRVAYRTVQVDLVAGEQKETEYRAENPQELVPLLAIDGLKIAQSLAICDYLERAFPEPRLVPAGAGDRALVLSMALAIACDVHPLNNLRVLKYLSGPLQQDEAARTAWYRHWVREGFAALETIARPVAGSFLFGDSPSLADVFLVPQMFNARRFDVPVDDFPTLLACDEAARALEPFAAAHPERAAPDPGPSAPRPDATR